MKEKKIPLVVVAGPTASGKTALAVRLSRRFGGEVVSADSMQIYRTMDIATAKPTLQEQQGIPHHLIDFLAPSQPFSVAEYAKLAHAAIQDVDSRGKLPILAGGTGLYIDSVVNNLSFSEIETDQNLRRELEQTAKQQGAEVLLDELRTYDPETAARLHPNNLTRIVRAVEVYRLTGITMSEHQRRSRQTPQIYRALELGLDFRDRQKLYDRIDLRVEQMLAAGLLAEAKAVYQAESLQTARQAIGYKELFDYFSGKETLEQAVCKIKQESRRYAKRQLTWFRRNPHIHWFYVDEFQNLEDLADQAAEKVNELLLKSKFF